MAITQDPFQVVQQAVIAAVTAGFQGAEEEAGLVLAEAQERVGEEVFPFLYCVVRSKADGDSGGIRTPVPEESGHAFRLILDS